MMMIYPWLIIIACLINQISSLGESISFAYVKNNLTEKSFWTGSISSNNDEGIFGDSVYMKLYVISNVGYLFSMVDREYRTLWLKIENEQLNAYTYDWFTQSVFKLNQYSVCDKVTFTILKIKIISSKNLIHISCNGKSTTKPYGYQFTGDSMTLKDALHLPIPIPKKINFKTATVWLGSFNTKPSSSFFNMVDTQGEQFEGAILEIKFGQKKINFYQDGTHVGNSTVGVTLQCTKPNMCNKYGVCRELMHNAYNCDCSQGLLVGEKCDKDYCVMFNGKTYHQIKPYTFSKVFSFGFKVAKKPSSATAMYSLVTIFLQKPWYIEIALSNEMKPRVILAKKGDKSPYERGSVIDMTLVIQKQYKIVLKYSKKLKVEVIDMDSNIKMRKEMKLAMNIFIIESILIGKSLDTNSPNYFVGTITNFQAGVERKLKIWNTNPKFSMLPKCQSATTPVFPVTTKPKTTTTFSTKAPKSKSSSTWIVVIILLVIIILIFIILAIVYLRMRRPQNSNENHFTTLHANNSINNSRNHNGSVRKSDSSVPTPVFIAPVPTYVPSDNSSTSTYTSIPFKPPYKAKSLSFGLGETRSNSSTRNGTLATLVHPEDFHTVKEESSSSSSLTHKETPKIDIPTSHHVSSPTIIDTHKPQIYSNTHRANRNTTGDHNLSATLPAIHNQPQNSSNNQRCYSVTDNNHPSCVNNDNDDDTSFKMSLDRYNTLANERSVARVMWKKRRCPSYCTIDR